MTQKEPFLAGFSKSLYGKSKRSSQEILHRFRLRSLRDTLSSYALLFDAVLPAEFLTKIDPTKRDRHFGHVTVFWAWLGQILEHNASCSRALSLVQAWCVGSGIGPPKGGTSAYCQGRLRIRLSFLVKILTRTNELLRRCTRSEDLWNGLVLKAIDGTSVKLLDTPANQALYPQPSSQKSGCGFPVMGMVGMLHMSHGGWEGFTTCKWNYHDARAAQRLLHYVEEGDLILADRAFCSYELIARIQQRGGYSLMRLHQARQRKLDWRHGKKISPMERLVTWAKPAKQPEASDLSVEQWDQLPDTLTLRYIKMGYEDRYGQKRMLVVVTTLLDAQKYDALEVGVLYASRWEIELKFRDVKTTMKMEEFAVKSPEMAHKTLYMMMIAYNLLRTLIQKSAAEAGKPLSHMSLKGTLDVVNSSHALFRATARHPRKRALLFDEVIRTCASKIIDIRPFRQQPRAVKRRLKPFQLLTAPRRVFREVPHKEGYRKRA